MRIEHLSEPAEIREKRFYAPLVFIETCPECGEEVRKDCSSDYLSYPDLNKPTKIYFCHSVEKQREDGSWWDDEHEFERWAILRITAEESEPPEEV